MALMPPDHVARQGVVALQLTDYVNLHWNTQLVTYPVSFPPGACLKNSILVTDEQGKAIPFQLSELSFDEAGKCLKNCRVSFLSDLAQLHSKQFGVYYSAREADKTGTMTTDLTVSKAGESAWELRNARMALRVAAGAKSFSPAALSVDVPSPLMAVKGPDGVWRGKGYLDTYWRVKGYESQIVESGPLFVDVRMTYHFEQDKTYTMKVRLTSEQDWALVDEQMDLGPRSKFIFDCSVGFQPDKLFLLGNGANALTRDLHYYDDIRQARMAIFTQYSQLSDFRDGLGVFESGPSKDFVGIFQYHPGQWSRPKMNFIEFWEHRQQGEDYLTRDPLTTLGKTDALPDPNMPHFQGQSLYQGHFTWEFGLIDGHRQWALTVVDKAAEFPKKPATQETAAKTEQPTTRKTAGKRGKAEIDKDKPASRLRVQYIQAGNCPLDLAKDLVLNWDEGPLPPPGQPAPATRPDDFHDQPPKQEVLPYLRKFVENFFYREGWGAIDPVTIRGVAPSCYRYESERAQGLYTSEQDKQIRACYAFLAYMLHAPDAYPYAHAMLPINDPESTEPLYGGMINQNFNTDRYNTVGRIGLSLRHHPQSKVWTDHFIQQLDAQLGFYLYPDSGCWEESVTYAQHVMRTILPTIHRLRTDLGVNLAKDPRLAKMFNFFVQIMTPFNPIYQASIIPGCGDHGEGNAFRDNYLQAAQEFFTVDPTFASQLMWAYRQMGGRAESAIEPKAPQLKSLFLQGFGAVLRANDREGKETYFILRTGEAWGHHHQDDNSIHLYAKGVPMISDAGKGEPALGGAWKYDAKGHSRVSLTDISAINFLGKTHRGWIKTHYFSDDVDYLLGYTPFLDETTARKDGNPALFNPLHPGWNERQVLFIRPDYFLIRDTVHTDLYGEEFYLHFDDLDQVTHNSGCVTATSRFGPQLEVTFLQPARINFDTATLKGDQHESRQLLEYLQHPEIAKENPEETPAALAGLQSLPQAELLEKMGVLVRGLSSSTTYIHSSQKPNTDFLFLLYPHKADQPAAKVEALPKSVGVKVTHEGSTDYLFLSHELVEYRQGDIEFKGRVGVIRVEGDKVTLSLPDGQLIRYKDTVIHE